MIIRHLLLAISLFLSLSFCEAGFGYDKCQGRADIALVVDSSTRMNPNNFFEETLKGTIKHVIESLDFASPSHMRLGLMLFGGENPEVIFDFNSDKNEEGYIAAVDSITSREYTNSVTSVAVRKAKTSLFDTASQREDKPVKFIVLITAGEASDPTEADAAINEVKSHGIHVFPFGIGDSISEDTLRRWKTEGMSQVSFSDLKYGSEHQSTILRQRICEDIRKANLIATNVCPDKYSGAYYCWPFGSVDQWKNTLDSNQHRKGRLNRDAQITKTASHDTVLDLTHTAAAVDLGQYQGECVSDPDQCSQGLTVMFDIKITQQMIDKNLEEGNSHQYIISSGGQRKDSRGFAFLFQEDDSNTGFKLQLQTSTADYVVPIPSVPDTWFTAAFTFKPGKCDLTTVTIKNVTCCYGLAKVRQKSCIESVGVNTGLNYYQDGKFVKQGAKTIGTFPVDTQTSVTIGRPNSKQDQYASFEMKNLVIWYSLLSPNDIERIATGRTQDQGQEDDHQPAELDVVKCKGRSDVVLLVDSSTNMSPEYFDVAKHTIKAIIKKFDYATPDNVRLALMLFGGADPEMIFDFDRYTNEADYIAAVDKMTAREYTESLTGVAVRKAKKLFDAATQRDDHPGKVVILIMAGEPTDQDGANAAVGEVNNDGILFPIGVGSAGGAVARRLASDMFYFGTVGAHGRSNNLEMITNNLCDAAQTAARDAEVAHEDAETARIFAEKAAQSKCPTKYNGAHYCWPFSLNSVWGDKTIEAIKHKTGTLHNGAEIYDLEGEGSFLGLLRTGASADLGDYQGECLSDPEQCTEGLTVMFDMKISSDRISSNVRNGNREQYIISTGGQKKKNRGFAFKYHIKGRYTGFNLQLSTSKKDYSLNHRKNTGGIQGDMNIPEGWITVAFTFKKDSGLSFYEDGQLQTDNKVKEKTVKSKRDEWTHMTIGRPNHEERLFANFRMKNLAIWYRVLSPDEIHNIFTEPAQEPAQEQAQEPAQEQAQEQAKVSCGNGYQRAKYCYPFDNVIENAGVAESPEVIAHLKNAVLKDGAVIADSSKRGKVLSLTEHTMSWATIGDFSGECASDPSLCANGVSVSFWLRLKQATINRRNDLSHAKQFIISTGGHTGRGFAMFYFKPESKYNLELRTDNTVFSATFSHVSEDWFHFAFKYKEGSGLVFYINGKEKGRNDGAPAISDSNAQTFLTIGRPDATSAATTTYGSFRLDHLVIFYKEITKEELDVIVPPKENPTPDTQHDDSTATCGTGYEGARFCWPFDSASTTALGTISQEIITRTKNAELKDGAVIADSLTRGKVLSLDQQRSWVNAGDFQGECTSDISLCSEGISVMFWLRIRPSDIENNGANHQYIISSGGQVESARGFSFLYAKEESKFKLQIKTTTNVYISEFASLPGDWFHFAFTFKKGNGLFYYINELKTGPVAAQAGSYITDTYTTLTIGKPNHADRMYGTFRMDHLVIFYKQVTQEEINTILQVPAATTQAPAKTQAATTNAPVNTQAATTKAPVATQAATTQAPITVRPAKTKAPTVVGGKCTARIDVVIVLDNSGSIEARNHDGFFSKMKTFAKHVYHSFQVGSVADVALVESGTSPKIIFNFGKFKYLSNMDSAVNSIKYKKQRSFIGKALELVRTDVIAKVACKKSTKVVIVITDGYSSDDVTLPSELLRNTEVTVVSVGFGKETPYMKYALQTMASDPKDQFSFIFDYGDIMEGVSKVVAVACQAANVDENQFALDKGAPQGGASANFKAKFLEEANKYRRMHSAVPLVWSDKLATKAQIWAEKLAREQQTKHMPTSSLGQAIFVSTVPLASPAVSSVRAWYNQILFYDFQRPKINSMNRYFVHLVWRASVDVGVGLAVSSTTPKQTYIVAFFDPAEDLEENVKYNVLPVTGSAVVGIKPGSCPEGFQSEADYCYKLFTESTTWLKAVKACNDLKASLVSVTDQDEHSFLTQMLSKSTILRSWIGLNDRLREGAFSWIDGMPLSFHGWQSAPLNGSKKDCVEYDTEKGWINNNCEVIRPYVCKSLKPGDVIFVVTLHYPTETWSADLVHGSSDVAVNLIKRVDKLIKDVYSGKDWFLSYTIKAFRGHVSVMIDIEMRFAPGAPIDPLAPLKKVVFSEECEGYLCDIPDIQLVPAMNVTYNSTQCQPSCYVSCSASCEPVCCSPDNSQNFYGYEIISFPATSPPAPPPPSPPASPVYVQSQHIQPSAYQMAYSSYCPQVCNQQCLPTCPRVCCTQQNYMTQYSSRRGK